MSILGEFSFIFLIFLLLFLQVLQIKDFEEKCISEILKKSLKTGYRFTVISDLQNNEKRVLFQVGKRQLNQKFPEKVYSSQLP